MLTGLCNPIFRLQRLEDPENSFSLCGPRFSLTFLDLSLEVTHSIRGENEKFPYLGAEFIGPLNGPFATVRAYSVFRLGWRLWFRGPISK